MTEIAGQVAVVTGGGSGIGRGLAAALAAEGASVVVADIVRENAAEVAAQIRDGGGSAVAVECDVCDRESIRNLKREAFEAFGNVSLLFANAGATWFDRLTDMSDDDVDWIVHVNLLGVTNCLKAFLPDMLEAGEGHVVATASTAGLFPEWIPYHAPYSAAKAGILGLMLAMRPELSEAGVGCTVYCPGGVLTGLRANNMRYRPARFGGPSDEALKKNANAQVTEIRFLTPDQVAPIVLGAVRKNAGVVVDHSEQRQLFMDHYVSYVLAAFDEAEAYEQSVLPAPA